MVSDTESPCATLDEELLPIELELRRIEELQEQLADALFSMWLKSLDRI
jgi:hypothetical protein